jgi:S-DNA-T family DNA segregation ATPase FtsK/SpoIIIE
LPSVDNLCENVGNYFNKAKYGAVFLTGYMKKAKQNKISTVDENSGAEMDFEKEVEEPKPKVQRSGKLAFLKDERLHKVLGLVFTLFSVYLLIAIFSFLLTWKADQSLVLNLGWDMFLQTDPDAAENLLGKIGAWVGYSFVYKGFGIASVLFSLCSAAIGIRLLTQIEPIPIGKTFRYSFFAIIWISLAAGFVFTDIWQILGGTFGHFGFLYLKGLIGTIGAGLLLVCYALVFAVAVFNIKFYEPKPVVSIPEPEIKEEEKSNSIIPPVFVDDAGAHELEALNPDDFQLTVKENEAVEMEEAAAVEIPEPETVADEEVEEVEEPEVLEIPEIEIPVAPVLTSMLADLKTDSGLVLEVQETPEEEVLDDTAIAKYGSLDSEYDPTLDYSSYEFPTLDLLNDYGGEGKSTVETAELQLKTKMIEDTLKNYNIGIKKISATIGPTVTLYEIVPQDGVRIAKIKNLEDDIALSLAALGIRIIAPIPGRGTIGIEVPNEKPAMVSMRSALSSSRFQNAEMDLPIAFGKNIQNEVFVADLAKMPHLLMAGATGQGKSVGLNAILVSLLYKKHPSQIKFVLVDPKKVELSIYKTIERHFLAKIPGDGDAIITDTKLVVNTLNSLCVEMDSRYDLLKDAQVRNLKEYNAKFVSRRLVPTDKIPHRFLPFIVVVIDEVADLMMTAGKEVEMPIARIAQLARAVGIHMILATQRPSVNVITGMIKANFPARVAFRVSQKTDSRTILDANGADQLIGKGDMLYTVGNDLVRLQCAFVDTPEVDKIANFIGAQKGKEPYLLPEVKNEESEGGGEDFDPRERDSLFEEAAQIIVQHQQGSTSLLQRRLNLGYNRAGRLIDQLEKAGIVGPFKGSKAREVLVSDILQLEDKLAELRERN